MCDEDARDEEAQVEGARARGQFHTVTLDVEVRVKVDVLGASHEADDIFDMVTGDSLCEGDIQNVEEV